MEVKTTKRNIQQFTGEKYSVWKFRVKALLDELNVLHVVNNEPPEVITDEWRKCDSTAKSVIVEYLSDSFLDFVKDNVTARNIFLALDNIYERRSLATQLALRKKLLTLRLQSEVTLMQHFINFDSIIADLVAAGAVLDELDKISHLLLTLPSSYDGIATALETLGDDTLTLAFVKTRLLDFEVKLHDEERQTTSLKILSTAAGPSGHKGTSKKKWKPRVNNKKQWRRPYFPKNTQYKFNKKACEHCGRRNHEKSDCYYYKRLMQGNNSQTLVSLQPMNNNEQSFAFMMGNVPCVKEADTEVTFLLDSGATDHIIKSDNFFSQYEDLSPPIQIQIAKNGETLTAWKRGNIRVTTGQGITGTLKDVLFAPDTTANLLSVRRMQENGMRIIFDTNGVLVQNGNKRTIMTGKPLNNLFGVVLQIRKNMVAIGSQINKFKLWHERLGHISNAKFNQIKHHQLFDDVDVLTDVKTTNDICEPCIFGKQGRLPFNKIKCKNHVDRPLFIVHTDVCGPITPPTIDNKNYFVTFIDSFTHYTVTYLLILKSEVLHVFKDFVRKSEAHFNLKVVNLYCDNGREYLSNDFKAFCSEKGITFHLTIPYTPQQNGVAERMNRTITEKARAMLNAAKLTKQFWGEAVLTATYLINLTPTKAVESSKTPYELWHHKKPKLSNLKVFGSTVYIHVKKGNSKFDDKSIKGILVGYEPNGYKIWNVETEKMQLARDVIIDETNFEVSRPRLFERTNNPLKASQGDHEMCELNKKHITIPDDSKVKTPEGESQTNNNNNKTTDLRRSERIKNRPQLSYDENQMGNEFYSYAVKSQTVLHKIPTNYNEIKERDDRTHWELAIKNELASLYENKTWTFVSKPVNTNIVSCKWVFTLKIDEHGNPTRYKARLVARGFTQKYHIDYEEIYAPVARITTFRFLLAFANQFDLLIHQMDVKTAFLNGNLKEVIYMQIPEGVQAEENQVCKLNKSIYGLKQSSRCWYERFDSIIREKGFKNSSADPCLYFLNRGSIRENIYVLLYVDDILIVTADTNTMLNFKTFLNNCFKMTDLNEVKIFLGIYVERNQGIISLQQTSYLKGILRKFGMEDCKAVDSPLPVKPDYIALNSKEQYDAPCKNLIGCLMYAMLSTRPDLCFAISFLSRFQSKNSKELWKCLKRVLRYVKGTLDLKLTYTKGEYENVLSGFVDADWGSNELDRKSTSGYIFKVFENCTIAWNTRRQNTIATSSMEAEYIALFEGVKEAIWLKSLLTSIDIGFSKAIVIYEDNQGCISIAKNPTHHKRSKHIDIKYHFTRDMIQKGYVTLKYLPTGEQLADVFTKTVTASKLMATRFNLGLY